MKLGFDIHGVIDTFEVFPFIIENYLDRDDVEIYIISGLSRRDADGQIGHLVDLDRIDDEHYFSIADYLEDRPDVEVTWKDGMPWADEEAWNRAKADYCDEEGIDILFDDSPIYAQYFDNIDTIFCQIHNPNRKRYKTR